MTELVTIERAEIDALQADSAAIQSRPRSGAAPAACGVRAHPGRRSPVTVWREYRGLSGAELARQTGISRAFLFQIEAGTRSAALGTVRKLAEAEGGA